MYSQDQFEPLMKNSCKTQTFTLTSNILNNSLQLHLKSAPTYKEYHRYSTTISMQDLEQTLFDKFENIKNLQMFLSDPHNIQVDLKMGVIQLIISISLLNGKTITTKLGEIRMKEDIFDSEKCLEHILAICEDKDNIFNEKSYKNVVRQLANLIKVLFRKMENLEEHGNGSGDRQVFYSFNKSVSSGKNIKYLHHSPLEKTLKSEKNVHERTRSVNQESQLMEIDDGLKTVKIKTDSNRELEVYKILADNKFSILTQKQTKYEEEVQRLKQTVEQMRKEIADQLKRSGDVQAQRNQRRDSINKIKENEFMMLRSSLSDDRNQCYSPSLSHSPSLRSRSKSIEKAIKSTDTDEKLNKLKVEFEDFSNAVVKKIQNLGVAHELFQDKLKRVVEELDLRMEERNMEQAIFQVKNRIIDTSSPFFQQFELTDTEIQYKGEDSISTMLLGKIKIVEKNKFSIKIVKTLVSNIQIGIADYEYRNVRDCWTMPNFILYVGWNSTIYEGPNDMLHKEGQPIVEGDVITFRANIETGLVEWLVGKEVRAKAVWEKLKDKSINWVPVVRFYDHGDVISWMTDKMFKI